MDNPARLVPPEPNHRRFLKSHLTPTEWIEARRKNCLRIAETKSGSDREGWLEDAEYFQATLDLMRADPNAVTLDENDEAQVKAIAKALCLEIEGTETLSYDYEPESRAVIRAIKRVGR